MDKKVTPTATVTRFPRASLHQLTVDDLDGATKLIHRCWHDAYRRHLPPRLLSGRTLVFWDDYLTRRLSRTWLAKIGDRPAGIVSASANCIDDLWVLSRYRNRGLGSQLLTTALADITKRGYQHAQVGCENFNRDAIAFFEHHGWQELGREPLLGLVPGRQIEAVVLSKSLASEIVAGGLA